MTGRVNPSAVLSEGDGKDWSRMAGVSRFQIAGLRVVNARGAVAAGRGEIGAVAAPGQRHDPVGVLLDDQLLLAAGDLVNANGVVRAADRESRAVRAEIHRQR